MFAHALVQGGPRLADGLPPTLQPNAIHLAAPASDRRVSLLASCVVYSFLLSGLALATREGVVAPGGSGRTRGERIVDLDLTRPPEPPPAPAVSLPALLPPVAAKAAERPEPPPVDSNAFPDYVPKALPTRDRSLAGFTGGAPGTGTPSGLLPAGPQVSHPVADPAPPQPPRPVEVDMKDMRVVQQVNPAYPSLAKLAKIEGPVVLLMTVDTRGIPSLVQVVSGHPALSGEAARVAALWRFEPARVGGSPVAAQFRLTVVFRLAR
jgi:protein TonB